MDAKDLLASVSNASDETEFYTPLPDGYKLGQCRYVIVVGTVMSGLGKGIFSSSLARLLKDKGFTVAPIKLEGYLNIDSGTLNPYRHGEVFVLDDGKECDMDLGTYERMLDQNLSSDNFATSGQILTEVLNKERQGGYLGRDVQMIPHVTGEVKHKLRSLASKTKADVVFVEVGGTVGDYENAYYIEAARELAYEEGPGKVCFVALTYVMEPQILGEQKSKAAQLGVKRLMEMGIQPHIIACRAANPVSEKVRQKISIYTNVPLKQVVSMHDRESIYMVPEQLRQAGTDRQVLELLELTGGVDEKSDQARRTEWLDFVSNIVSAERQVTIGITGKYTAVRDSYASILKALEHAGAHLGTKVSVEWIDTTDAENRNVPDLLANVHGIIVPGGFGTRGTEGKIACIEYARTHDLPYLGICLGFQMAVLEFARNVCGLTGANSTEFDPDCSEPVIDILPEQKKIEGLGGNMRLGGKDIAVKKDTMAWRLFGREDTVRMRFRHRYEVDPRYIDRLTKAGLVFSGKSPQYEIMQILELPEHPYFIGTQAHPCLTSRPLRPNPMFLGLAAAALARAYPADALPQVTAVLDPQAQQHSSAASR